MFYLCLILFYSFSGITNTNQFYTKQETGQTCQFPSSNPHQNNNNEESEFINQALEAIENNIEANSSQQSSNLSSHNNSAVESSNNNSQSTSSSHPGIDQRRLSQQSNNYSWNNSHQSSNGQIVLPGNDTQQTSGGVSQNQLNSSRSNVVPPPGPGPGSKDCDTNRPVVFNSPTSFPGQSITSSPKASSKQQQLENFSSKTFQGQGKSVFGSNPDLGSAQKTTERTSEDHKQAGTNGTNSIKPSPPQQSSKDSTSSNGHSTDMYYQQYRNQTIPTNQSNSNPQQYRNSNGASAPSPSEKTFLSPTTGRSTNGSQQQFNNGPVFHNMQPSFDNHSFPSKLKNPQQKDQITENGTVNNNGNYQIGHQQQSSQFAAINHPETSNHPYTSNPGLNPYHRSTIPQQRVPVHPNGQSLQQNSHWNGFQHSGAHTMRPGGPENLSSPPFMQSSQQPPKQHSPYPGSSRRPSSHISGQNNLSPMMQTSPAGSNVSAQSPFRGSLAAGLQSPPMIPPSPSGHHPASPSVANQAHITHSNSTPNFSSNLHNGYQGQHLQQLTTRQSWSSSSDLNQSSVGYHGHATGHIVGDFTSGKPNVMNQHQHPSLPHAANHFLAQPGNSHNSSSQARVCASNSVSYNGDQRAKNDKITSNQSSLAVARSSSTEGEHQNHNVFSNSLLGQKQHFQETMNSVLYGTPGLGNPHHAPSSNLVSTLSSDSSNDGNRKAMSPIDAQATISPGESGYDSAELSSVLSENSTYSNAQGKQDGSSITKPDSKNLYAASVGSTNQQQLGMDSSFLSSALAAANGEL